MTTEELKYIDIPENDKRYEVAVTSDTLNNYASAIVKSKSGAIASFTDGADDVPVKSLKVNIAPKQSGSGDPSPSNVRPISGWDEVEVVRCGKNLLDPTHRYDTSSSSSSNLLFNYYYMEGVFYKSLFLKKGVTYTFSFDGPTASGMYIKKNGATNAFYQYNTKTLTFTPTEDFYASTDIYWTSVVDTTAINPMLTVGSTATPYGPYNGETKSISLPSTVYGGTLNVTTGELVIDRGFVTFDGSSDEVITWNSGNTLVTIAVQNGIVTDAITQSQILTTNNMFKDASWTTRASVDGTVGMYFGRSFIFVKYSEITSEASARTFLASNPLQVAYKLQNPTTVQLTPTEINTLLGSNNIWSDAGTVEVEYRADTTLAYNELLSLIANM